MLSALFEKLDWLVHEKPHLIRFAFAGVLNTAVHFISFTALIIFLSIEISNVLAFLVANIFSFFVASYFVFKVKKHSLRQYIHFLSVSSLGAGISYGIGALCSNLTIPAFSAPFLVAVIIPPISYLMQRSVFWRERYD